MEITAEISFYVQCVNHTLTESLELESRLQDSAESVQSDNVPYTLH